MDDLFGPGGWVGGQAVQSSSEETAHSELSWEPEVNYQWIVRKIGLGRADMCLVSQNDPQEAYRFVVFHFEEGTPAWSLSTSLPDFIRYRRNDGLAPNALNRVFRQILGWWVQRWWVLPADVEAEVRSVLQQHEQDFAAMQAGPLTLEQLRW
jgi:hypothetical protein